MNNALICHPISPSPTFSYSSFLGLTRPPKIFGLPIGYFVSLMLGSVIPFVGANNWRFLLFGVKKAFHQRGFVFFFQDVR